MTTSASLLSSCASACSMTTNAWLSIAAVLPSPLCSSGCLETSTAMTRSAPDSRATFTGTGLTSPPVDIFAPAYRRGLENHRHAARGAHRHAGVAAREGDELAGGELGGDRDERNVELLDQAPLQRLVDVGLEAIAFDETAVRKYEVDQLIALHGERRLEQLVVAYAAGVERSHQAARAGADHEVGADSGVVEHLQDPGVCETARAAAAEHERDQGAVRLAGQNQRLGARRVLGWGRQARTAGHPQRERDDDGRCGAEERSRAGHRKIVSASPEDGNPSPFAPIYVRLRTDRP